MNGLRPPFDRNPVPTYLPNSTNPTACGKEVDRGATSDCQPRFGERVLRSVRESPGLHAPVLAPPFGKQPSLLLPSHGTRIGDRTPVKPRNALAALGREDNDRP